MPLSPATRADVSRWFLRWRAALWVSSIAPEGHHQKLYEQCPSERLNLLQDSVLQSCHLLTERICVCSEGMRDPGTSILSLMLWWRTTNPSTSEHASDVTVLTVVPLCFFPQLTRARSLLLLIKFLNTTLHWYCDELIRRWLPARALPVPLKGIVYEARSPEVSGCAFII